MTRPSVMKATTRITHWQPGQRMREKPRSKRSSQAPFAVS